jgi:hypothetical protein
LEHSFLEILCDRIKGIEIGEFDELAVVSARIAPEIECDIELRRRIERPVTALRTPRTEYHAHNPFFSLIRHAEQYAR